MSRLLQVCSVPQTFMAFTNSFYVSPDATGMSIGVDQEVYARLESKTVAGKYIYGRLMSHGDISPNMVGLTSLQRVNLGTTEGEHINISIVGKSEISEIFELTLDFDYLGRSRVAVSETEVNEFLKSQYLGKLLYPGCVFCMKYQESAPLKFTVKTIQGVFNDNIDDIRVLDFGLITKHTNITVNFDQTRNRLVEFTAAVKRKSAPLISADWKFEQMGIGGLDAEFSTIFRRAFASRLLPPEFVERLGIKHVKGMLLYGPPGTGKTLIARQIGKMLGGVEPVVVNGPEILNKYVGQAEENIRNLFAPAIEEYNAKKENSDLHVIIFDEIDAICKARGSVRSGTGVHDTVVNQLLTMIDGINTPNNILVIGMTNRKDMLDPALLRPGRLEVHVEISLPDKHGRLQILNIHTKQMRQNHLLDEAVDLAKIAEITKNFSGSEIEGLVKSATSYAVSNSIDVNNVKLKEGYENIRIKQEYFEQAATEIHPAYGVDEDDIQALCRNGIIHYSKDFEHSVYGKIKGLISNFHDDKSRSTATVLLEGPSGTGKTALAADLALRSEFPFVKLVAPQNYIGLSESAKASEIASVFDQAYKSPLSTILIDNIETLLEYVPIGPRFSNIMLQTFLTLLNRPHPKPERKLLVIVTTSSFGILKQMQMRPAFQFIVEVPKLTLVEDIKYVLLQSGFKDTPELDTVVREDIPTMVAIKPLLLVAKVAKTPDMVVNREIFREWLINCGVGLKDKGSHDFAMDGTY